MVSAGEGGELPLRRCLRNSRVLSSDVSAGYDPAFASVFEKKNSAFLGAHLTGVATDVLKAGKRTLADCKVVA